MSKNGKIALIIIILLAGGGLAYWYMQRSSNSAGTSQLNSAVQQDLSYYQAWNDAQQADQNQPSGQSQSPSTQPGGPDQSTTNSQTQSLPVGV